MDAATAAGPDAPPVQPSSRLRSVLADSAWYGVGLAAMPLALALATPVLARALDPAGYGTVEVVVTVVSFVSIVTALGMDNAVARSWFDYGPGDDRRRTLVQTGIAVAAGVGAGAAVVVVAASAVALTAGSAGAAAAAAAIAFATLPFTNAYVVARMAFLVRRNRTTFVVLSLLHAGVGVAAAILLVLAGLGAPGFFAGIAVGTLAAVALAFPRAEIRLRGPWLDRHELGVMLRYGIPLAPAAAATWFVFAVDRTLIASLRDLTEAGYYGVASKVSAPIALLASAFAVAWAPFILRHPAQHRAELQARALTGVAATAGFLLVCLVLFARPLVELLGGAEFAPAARAVPGITLGWAAWSLAAVLATPLAVERRTRVIAAVTTAAAIVNVALNVVLIPPFGIVGAAWVSAASFALVAVAYALWDRRARPSPYRWRRVAAVAAVTGLATVAVAAGDDAAGLAAKAAVAAAAFVALAALVVSDRPRPAVASAA